MGIMPDKQTQFSEIYEELKSFVDESFPQECNTCGKVYDSLAELLDDTDTVGEPGTFVDSLGYEDSPFIDMCRNCSCGSSLMVVFESRRDLSEAGQKRREKFQTMMELVVSEGVDRGTARTELLKILSGRPSKVISEQLLFGDS